MVITADDDIYDVFIVLLLNGFGVSEIIYL